MLAIDIAWVGAQNLKKPEAGKLPRLCGDIMQ